jgi:hypothetical protein
LLAVGDTVLAKNYMGDDCVRTITKIDREQFMFCDKHGHAEGYIGPYNIYGKVTAVVKRPRSARRLCASRPSGSE